MKKRVAAVLVIVALWSSTGAAQSPVFPGLLTVRDAHNKIVGTVLGWSDSVGSSQVNPPVIGFRTSAGTIILRVQATGFLGNSLMTFQSADCSGVPLFLQINGHALAGGLGGLETPNAVVGTTVYVPGPTTISLSGGSGATYMWPNGPCQLDSFGGAPIILYVGIPILDLSRFTPPFTLR